MNWLERARREICGSITRRTANTAEGHPTAVLYPTPAKNLAASIGSNGSAPPWQMLESETLREAFGERAAIMEYDGGVSREDAERAAWADILKHHQLH